MSATETGICGTTKVTATSTKLKVSGAGNSSLDSRRPPRPLPRKRDQQKQIPVLLTQPQQYKVWDEIDSHTPLRGTMMQHAIFCTRGIYYSVRACNFLIWTRPFCVYRAGAVRNIRCCYLFKTMEAAKLYWTTVRLRTTSDRAFSV